MKRAAYVQEADVWGRLSEGGVNVLPSVTTDSPSATHALLCICIHRANLVFPPTDPMQMLSKSAFVTGTISTESVNRLIQATSP